MSARVSALAELDLLPADAAVAPSAGLRDRLLREVEGPARYAPFATRVARFFGIGVDDAARSLEAITAADAWRAGPLPGMWRAEVRGRAKEAGRTAIFLKSAPGLHCPNHRHVGEERLLILEGGIVESDGTEYHPGDLVVKAAGSSHSFTVPTSEACVSAYLLEGGLELVP
jgi:quercetin dioxygenase-like cupin family protein